MIDSMQAAYVRILRKIKQKSDGESAEARAIVKDGVEKLLAKFSDHAGIIEAARKLYSTAIKTYKLASTSIAEISTDGAQLLYDQFGKTACTEISLIFSSAIIQYLQLNSEDLAKTLTKQAADFFTQIQCPEQAANIQMVLTDPRSKSDIKLF